jgi:hypothetical protein
MSNPLRPVAPSSSVLFALVALSTAGCMHEVASGDDPADLGPAGEEDVVTVSNALESADFVSDDDDVRLYGTAAGFCYLTEVTGSMLSEGTTFRLAGGMARLEIRDGAWRLTTTRGVRATARCTWWQDWKNLGSARLFTTPEGFMVKSSWPQSIGTLWDDRSLCFLSGVSGHEFGGATARVERNPGAWSLTVGSPIGTPYDSAMCIATGRSAPFRLRDAPGGGTSFAWTQGQPDTWMMPVSQGVCMLTGISGRFAGGGESVEIVREDGYYKLRGRSMQQGVGARAQCVPYEQLVLTGMIRITPF